MSNLQPVVLVHGMFGFGPNELGLLNYWGAAFRVPSPLDLHEASVGPISSPHDRACELAAQIKGAIVDYGENHAQRAGHKRFGKDFSGDGYVPEWNQDNPIHLVGHSLGAPTIRCLQTLLAQDYWGWGSSEAWICSVNSLSGPNNGSTVTYYFGSDQQSGLLKPDSGILPILRLLELYTSATGGILDMLYDFDLDHWGFKRLPDEDLLAYLHRVGESDFFWGQDNALYNATLQGAYTNNGVWPTYPNTYYFSYITEQTFQGPLSGRYYPEPCMNPALLATSTYIGQKEFAAPPTPDPHFESSDWWENDGLVPTYSQHYPHTNGNHQVGIEFFPETSTAVFEPGRWHYEWERGIDHGDICISPQLDQIGWQRRFYIRLFQRLAELEIA